MDDNKEYRGIEAIAERFGKSVDTIRRWIDDGTITVTKMGREYWTTERMVMADIERGQTLSRSL
jgi:excisionase family DNA binding protein